MPGPLGTHLSGPVVNKAIKENGGLREWFSNLPVVSDPGYVHFFNDYTKAGDYSTTDTTLTLVGSGTAAVNTTSNEVNGVLLLTTTNGNGPDSNNLQYKTSAFKLDATGDGKRLWFETSVKPSNVADVDVFVGLAVSGTAAQSGTDRVGFRMTTGAATLAGETSLSSSATSSALGVSLVTSAFTQLGFLFDAGNSVKFYVNRSWVKTISTTIPTADLQIAAYVAANSANARTLSVDYFYCVKER